MSSITQPRAASLTGPFQTVDMGNFKDQSPARSALGDFSLKEAPTQYGAARPIDLGAQQQEHTIRKRLARAPAQAAQPTIAHETHAASARLDSPVSTHPKPPAQGKWSKTMKFMAASIPAVGAAGVGFGVMACLFGAWPAGLAIIGINLALLSVAGLALAAPKIKNLLSSKLQASQTEKSGKPNTVKASAAQPSLTSGQISSTVVRAQPVPIEEIQSNLPALSATPSVAVSTSDTPSEQNEGSKQDISHASWRDYPADYDYDSDEENPLFRLGKDPVPAENPTSAFDDRSDITDYASATSQSLVTDHDWLGRTSLASSAPDSTRS